MSFSNQKARFPITGLPHKSRSLSCNYFWTHQQQKHGSFGGCEYSASDGKYHSEVYTLRSVNIVRYSENVFFSLIFVFGKFFVGSFTFQSACHFNFLVVQLSLIPVIFTSCMLLNIEHRLEYFRYLVITSIDIFQAQFYRLDLFQKIIVTLITVFIFIPDFQS